MGAQRPTATGRVVSRLVAAAALLSLCVRAEENCSTVDVSGGDIEGTFAQTSVGYKVEGTHLVLQPIEYDEGANRRRRDLVEFLREGKASGDADAGTAGRTRSLSDEDPCSSQMWILVNTSAIIDGFPYYAAYDCAEHPVDINSTWVFVTCSNCSQETLAVAVVCSKSSTTDALSASDEEESSESLLSTPTIVVIAVGLAIFVCLILGCCAYRRKRAPRGSSSFEHESELTDHKIGSGGDAGTIGDASSVVGLGAESSAVGEPIGSGTVGPSSVANSVSQHTQVGPDASVHTSRSSLKGAHAAPMAIRNNPSYHSGHNSPPYDPRAISMQSASGASGVMIDSMAASAAAAVAAIGQNSSGPQQPPPAVALVGGPERHRRGGGRGGGVSRVVHEDNIVWSAGQDYTGRNGRYNGHMPSASENGDDSAAGSVFSLNPDNVPDRAYYDSESVPASSPGGYSMYSYFTAGGNSVYPGDLDDRHEGSEMSWNAEDELHRQSHHVHHAHHVQPQGARRGSGIRSTNPPPYGDSHVDAVLADPGAIPAQQVGYRPTKEAHLMRSPAGLAARADLATREGSRRTRDPKERSLNRAEPLRKAVAQRQ